MITGILASTPFASAAPPEHGNNFVMLAGSESTGFSTEDFDAIPRIAAIFDPSINVMKIYQSPRVVSSSDAAINNLKIMALNGDYAILCEDNFSAGSRCVIASRTVDDVKNISDWGSAPAIKDGVDFDLINIGSGSKINAIANVNDGKFIILSTPTSLSPSRSIHYVTYDSPTDINITVCAISLSALGYTGFNFPSSDNMDRIAIDIETLDCSIIYRVIDDSFVNRSLIVNIDIEAGTVIGHSLKSSETWESPLPAPSTIPPTTVSCAPSAAEQLRFNPISSYAGIEIYRPSSFDDHASNTYTHREVDADGYELIYADGDENSFDLTYLAKAKLADLGFPSARSGGLITRTFITFD